MNDNLLHFAKKAPEPVVLRVTVGANVVFESAENSDNVLLAFEGDQIDRVARQVMKSGLFLLKLREREGKS